MSDTPKRRGRPPKVRDVPMAIAPTDSALKAAITGMVNFVVEGAMPTIRFRFKAGRLQRAWQHPTGTQWRDVPVVPESAPDWEDA